MSNPDTDPIVVNAEVKFFTQANGKDAEANVMVSVELLDSVPVQWVLDHSVTGEFLPGSESPAFPVTNLGQITRSQLRLGNAEIAQYFESTNKSYTWSFICSMMFTYADGSDDSFLTHPLTLITPQDWTVVVPLTRPNSF
jgi:hypothetical protein